jgi:reductive dehalogenase
MRLVSNRNRPHQMSQFALERLRRDPRAPAISGFQPDDGAAESSDCVAMHCDEYRSLFDGFHTGEIASRKAPVPDDPVRRAENLKASAYFLDAAIAGCCSVDRTDWPDSQPPDHAYAFVFAVEFGRVPKPGQPGHGWIAGTNRRRTDMRCSEIAAVLSGYLRALGFDARGHVAGSTDLDIGKLAVRAGVARVVDGKLVAPFLKRGFRLGVVTTNYQIASDVPLMAEGDLGETAADVYMGNDGTRPGWELVEEDSRPLHLGAYPMETIKRVDEPTTLVVRQQIKRVSKRGDFFKRAAAGDLGDKAKAERKRFAMKHPLAFGMMPLIQGMVPLQGTREKLTPSGWGGNLADLHENANAIKALGYYLGMDFVGICHAESWMYYAADDVEGKPIEPYHQYAVVMLLDQGYETMSGASGDDWISASQSMRAYLRGAEIAGVMAAQCRKMGFSARTHSNAHSDVIHNPAILMAGLGEVSRIGDTLLNPFIGPRSKSVVFTTDLPMTVDKPIDFGLQDFCNRCRKCARECPCNAITFGDKVMFNGYEIWKADVEKCTKYRVTQARGSACGRCMKMCPWNREDTVESRRLIELSINVPAARDAIIKADDAQGNGARNPVKRWWFDLEMIDGIAVAPRAGTNERDLNLGRDEKLLGAGQKLAMFPPKLQPPPGATMADLVPADRVAGLEEYRQAEPADAARRRLSGSDH